MTELERCPLCSKRLENSVLSHLQSQHGLSQAEARTLVVHSLKTILGQDPELSEFTKCPLCFEPLQHNVLVHLQAEHRRTGPEARALVMRSLSGTLGWDPETQKQRASFRSLSSD